MQKLRQQWKIKQETAFSRTYKQQFRDIQQIQYQTTNLCNRIHWECFSQFKCYCVPLKNSYLLFLRGESLPTGTLILQAVISKIVKTHKMGNLRDQFSFFITRAEWLFLFRYYYHHYLKLCYYYLKLVFIYGKQTFETTRFGSF